MKKIVALLIIAFSFVGTLTAKDEIVFGRYPLPDSNSDIDDVREFMEEIMDIEFEFWYTNEDNGLDIAAYFPENGSKYTITWEDGKILSSIYSETSKSYSDARDRFQEEIDNLLNAGYVTNNHPPYDPWIDPYICSNGYYEVFMWIREDEGNTIFEITFEYLD